MRGTQVGGRGVGKTVGGARKRERGGESGEQSSKLKPFPPSVTHRYAKLKGKMHAYPNVCDPLPTHLPCSQLLYLFPSTRYLPTPSGSPTPQSHSSILNLPLHSHSQAMLIFHLLPPRARAPVFPPSADEPVQHDDEDDDAVDGGDVVHVCTRINVFLYRDSADILR